MKYAHDFKDLLLDATCCYFQCFKHCAIAGRSMYLLKDSFMKAAALQGFLVQLDLKYGYSFITF
jgi:hypothetical protein